MKAQDIFYSIFSLLLVALLLMSVNVQNSSLIWILYVGCIMLFFKTEYLIPVYLISSLSSDYFIFDEGLGISRIIGFIFIISALFKIIRENHSFIFKKNLFYLNSILIYCFISSFLFSITQSLDSFILIGMYILITILFSQFRNINLNIITTLIIISSLITILVLAFTLQESIADLEYNRLSTSESVNVNRFAIMLAQLSATLVGGILIFRNRISQIICVVVTLIALYLIFLSGSRSAVFSLIMLFVLFIMYSLKRDLYKMIIPIIFISILTSFFISSLESIDTIIINRFSFDGVISTGGSQDRFDVWINLFPKAIALNPLLGLGFGSENVYEFARINGFEHSAHNFVLDMLMQTGFLGFTLFFSYFIFLFKKIKSKIHNPMIFLPIALILQGLLNGFGETIFSEKTFWNSIALACLYINNINTKANQNVQNL